MRGFWGVFKGGLSGSNENCENMGFGGFWAETEERVKIGYLAYPILACLRGWGILEGFEGREGSEVKIGKIHHFWSFWGSGKRDLIRRSLKVKIIRRIGWVLKKMSKDRGFQVEGGMAQNRFCECEFCGILQVFFKSEKVVFLAPNGSTDGPRRRGWKKGPVFGQFWHFWPGRKSTKSHFLA